MSPADQHSMIATADDQEGHELFEFADEEQIIGELAGRVTDKYVYELKGVKDERGQPVVGLSYAGTNWACREYAKQGELIRVNPKPEVVLDPTDPEHVIVVVTAQRYSVDRATGKEIPLDTALGVKRQWKKQLRNRWENGRVVGQDAIDDRFFLEKAFSKAQRNAKQALIPTDFVTQIIQRALQQKNGKTVTRPGTQRPPAKQPPRQTPPAQPPPQTPAQAPPQAPPAQPPQQAQRPRQAPKPARPPQRPAAPPPQPGAKDDPNATRVKFWTYLKQATGSKDEETARGILKAMTGLTLPELTVETMKELGRLLWACIRNENKFDPSTNRILDSQNNQLWPPAQVEEADPFPDSGASEEPPPPQAPAPGTQPEGEPFGF